MSPFVDLRLDVDAEYVEVNALTQNPHKRLRDQLGSLCPRCKIQPLFLDEDGTPAVGQVHTISSRGAIDTKCRSVAMVTYECSNGHVWVEEVPVSSCSCSKGATCARCLGLTR